MQSEREIVCAMTKSIRTILMPFLITSYVFGLRIVNLSSHSRCVSLLYMLLIWSVYYFFSIPAFISSFYEDYPIEDNICLWLESFMTLLSIVFGVHHDKKFQNCLKKLDIMDNTLLKLGTTTDYDKLYKKTVWLVLGWFVIVILMMFSVVLFMKNEYNRNITTSLFFVLIRDYPFNINIIGDLTTASIIGYIGLKFDQVNEHLQNLMRNNKMNKIKWVSEHSMIHPHQCRCSKTLSNKYMIWTVIHLHLELRKISCEIDSIFGTQVSFKMACYFGWIALDLRYTLYAILNNNYVKLRIIFAILHFVWFLLNVFKFLLINYVCEIVSTKARTTADLLDRLSYFICDIEIREIISQFSLRIIYAPLKFCGIGFFQFGFKFLHRFVMFIATILVIIIQAQANK